MPQFTQDGVVYEEMPDGQVRVVGYANALAVGPSIGGNPKMPFDVQTAQGQAAAAPLALPKAAADLTRTQQQIESQPLQNDSTRASMQNQRFNQNQGLRTEWNALPISKNFATVAQKAGMALNAKPGPQGDLAILYAFATVMDPDSVVRESEQDMAKSTATRFAALKQQYNMNAASATLPEGVRPGLLEQIRANTKVAAQFYGQARGFYADLAKRNNFKPYEIVGPDPVETYNRVEANYIKANGGTPRDPNSVQSNVQTGLATGDFRSEYDPEFSAKLDALIRKGAPYSQAAALAKQGGFNPPSSAEYAKAAAYAKQNPQFRQSLAEATRTVPNDPFAQFAASPAGAFVSGAGKAATLGFGDEIAGAAMPGDYATNRDAFAGSQSILAGEHPTADFLGQMAGGAATGVGISSGLARVPGLAGPLLGARTPIPSLLSREGLAGDVAFGAGYGAGSENDSRLQGAAMGGAIGAGGGIAARGAVNGLASAISPTGGAMRPLYDMGVRPSIGQRMGGAINNFEEKLQSIPLLGDAIAGTRGRAVDQYQLGLFNDSLGHIGQQLPKGMKPGHEPHAFAQDAISRAYGSALSGMTAAADGPLSQDIGNIQRQLGTLKPDHRNQFQKIWADSVARRFQNGQLSGDAYKAAESDLSRRVAALRKNPADNELADMLEQATGALRGSAMRNSAPEAVSALNAADAAHAKIVRIENASRSAGGEPAEFSPKQYASATKNSSGGVRNRNYLRGDALNAELATLGNRLGDKVSNSGSIDRLLAGGALYGLNSVSPASAGVLGGLTAINAPGVRNVVTEAMAPRANPLFDRAADQLRQRARFAGMFGAPAALDYYGQ